MSHSTTTSNQWVPVGTYAAQCKPYMYNVGTCTCREYNQQAIITCNNFIENLYHALHNYYYYTSITGFPQFGGKKCHIR